LWAGSYVVARLVIDNLAKAYAGGRRPTVQQTIRALGLSQSEVNQISLIAFFDQDQHIVQAVLNVDCIERASASIDFAGTGSYPAILDLDDSALAGSLDDFYRAYLHRLTLMLLGDLFTRENADFCFGGWFELAQTEAGGVFSKIPYAVKLWSVRGELVRDGPALISGYTGHDLMIFCLERKAEKARHPYFISDLLRRSGRTVWRGEAPDKRHVL